MEPHEELLAWAKEQGVRLDGIEPKRIPGRGIGVVAARTIKPDNTVLEVPTPCLRSIDTVRQSIIRHLPKSITIHGLLAADLALDTSSKFAVWNAVCPTPTDFHSMPLVWPRELQKFLPPSARDLLAKQEAKLKKDWAMVSAAFPEQLDEERYRYAWLLVNTRTFYFLNAKLKRRKNPDDHMCLQPVADLFNHGDAGCSVAFDNNGFYFKARQEYKKGDEVKICYGRHSGDFLLVEYGFVMDENKWDEVLLDEVLLPKLDAKQKEKLEEVGYLGKYVLEREGVCHRTQVAMRLLCCGAREWKKFVDGADGERSQKMVDEAIYSLTGDMQRHADLQIAGITDLRDVDKEQKETLIRRWEQIKDVVLSYQEVLEDKISGDIDTSE
ncbi:SET domain-containing protein [Hypoxylon fuscum]|nr:SET domain-containing protein [Hypoxylon fuscum]